MKVSELSGAQLDYWVAQADHAWKTAHKLFPAWTLDNTFKTAYIRNDACVLIPNNPMRQDPQIYSPSTDWSQGGPIIEREKMCFNYLGGGQYEAFIHPAYPSRGKSILEAGMRCFVASKYKEDVPD